VYWRRYEKAATRQGLNCIKNKKINKIWRKTIFDMTDGILTPRMWHVVWNRDSEFTKWQHPAMWYVALRWHAIEFAQTSAILEFYIWFRFRPPWQKKNDVMSIFKMGDLRYLSARYLIFLFLMQLTSISVKAIRPNEHNLIRDIPGRLYWARSAL